MALFNNPIRRFVIALQFIIVFYDNFSLFSHFFADKRDFID